MEMKKLIMVAIATMVLGVQVQAIIADGPDRGRVAGQAQNDALKLSSSKNTTYDVSREKARCKVFEKRVNDNIEWYHSKPEPSKAFCKDIVITQKQLLDSITKSCSVIGTDKYIKLLIKVNDSITEVQASYEKKSNKKSFPTGKITCIDLRQANTYETTYHFKSDGTYSSRVLSGKRYLKREYGIWKDKGNKAILFRLDTPAFVKSGDIVITISKDGIYETIPDAPSMSYECHRN